MLLKIQSKFIRAAACLISKDPSRYVLHRINITRGPVCPILAATDGRALIAIQAEGTENESVPEHGFSFDAFAPAGSDVEFDVEGTTVSARTGRFIALLKGQIEPESNLAGSAKYPDWRKIFENAKGDPSPSCTFNPAMMERFMRAAKILNTSLTVHSFGNEGIRIFPDQGDGWFGVLMPLRRDDGPKFPDWVKPAATPEAAEGKGAA